MGAATTRGLRKWLVGFHLVSLYLKEPQECCQPDISAFVEVVDFRGRNFSGWFRPNQPCGQHCRMSVFKRFGQASSDLSMHLTGAHT